MANGKFPNHKRREQNTNTKQYTGFEIERTSRRKCDGRCPPWSSHELYKYGFPLQGKFIYRYNGRRPQNGNFEQLEHTVVVALCNVVAIAMVRVVTPYPF